MKIDFSNIEETVLHNFRGGDGDTQARMVTDEHNRIMKGRLKSGCSIGVHTHDTSSEIIFVISGVGRCIVDGVEEILTKGTCHYCKKGQTHTLINDSEDDLVFYAVIPQQ